eukprot:279938_1
MSLSHEVVANFIKSYDITRDIDGEHVFKLCNIHYYLQTRIKLENSLKGWKSLNKISISVSDKFNLLNILRHYGIYDVFRKLLESEVKKEKYVDCILWNESMYGVEPNNLIIDSKAEELSIEFVTNCIYGRQYFQYIYLKLVTKGDHFCCPIITYEHLLCEVSKFSADEMEKISFNHIITMLYLGLHYLHYSYILVRYFKNQTTEELRQNIIICSKRFYPLTNWDNSYKLLSKKLKQMSDINKIQNYGKEYIQTALSHLNEDTNAHPFIDYFEYKLEKLSDSNS